MNKGLRQLQPLNEQAQNESIGNGDLMNKGLSACGEGMQGRKDVVIRSSSSINILCTAINCAFGNGQDYKEKLNHEEHEEARRLELMLFIISSGASWGKKHKKSSDFERLQELEETVI